MSCICSGAELASSWTPLRGPKVRHIIDRPVHAVSSLSHHVVIFDLPEIVDLIRDVITESPMRDRGWIVTGFDAPVPLETVVESRPSLLVIDPRFVVGTEGWELLGRAQAHPVLSQIPVVVCTAGNGAVEGDLAVAGSSVRVLYKPFSFLELQQVLRPRDS